LNLPALQRDSPELPAGWHQDQLTQIECVTDWAELDEYAAKLEAMATYYQRTSESNLEIAKALRIVDKRRGELLGPAEQGKRTDLEPLHHDAEVKLPSRTAANYRTIAQHWPEIWPQIVEAKTPAQVSQRQCLKMIKKRQATTPMADTCTIEDLQSLTESGNQFGTIYADPPWLYDNQATRASTSNHYGGMTVDELCELPISQIAADDAHLHLWITNAFLFDAPRIFAAWGFEFRSSFVWVKPQMGIGNYWRNSHEILLTAIRGNAKRFNDKSIKSWGEFRRTKHSAKPEEIRSYIERGSPGPYLELFGRRKIDGWTVWGNEIERNLFNQ